MKKEAYFLSYDTQTFTVSIHIHISLMDFLQKIEPDNRLTNYIQNQNPELSLETNFKKNFGFGNCSNNLGRIDDCIVYAFQIPTMEYSNNPCTWCRGKGYQYDDKQRICPSCKGTKNEKLNKGSERWAICLTLSTLFRYLEYALSDVRQSGNEYAEQHVMLASNTEQRQGGMAIGGGISKDFFESCCKLYKDTLAKNLPEEPNKHPPIFIFEKAQEAMVHLWMHMNLTTEDSRIRHYTKALLKERGHFYIECQGENSCCIYTSDSLSYFFDEGKPLCDHNIDSTMQQLTLLVGLIMVYTEVTDFMHTK